jgi:hypothetical protein
MIQDRITGKKIGEECLQNELYILKPQTLNLCALEKRMSLSYGTRD